MRKYIDIHCHLQDVINVQELMSDALQRGVVGCVCNATRQQDWTGLIEIARQVKGVYCALGIHPWYVCDASGDWLSRLYDMLVQNPNLMLGEIGLDKHKPDIDLQVRCLSAQLDLAVRLDRCVHIHCVGEWTRLLQTLRNVSCKYPPLIFHSFNGGSAIMQTLLHDYDAYFSYSPVILKGGYNKTKETISTAPLDKMLVESDGADITTVPTVAKQLADVRGQDANLIIEQIYENSQRIISYGQTA